VVALTGVTQFKVCIDMWKIALCLHGNETEPTCRACSIGLAMRELGTDVVWYNDPVLPHTRVVEGKIQTEDGRKALSRLIAYANGHIDPLDLLAISLGRPTLWV